MYDKLFIVLSKLSSEKSFKIFIPMVVVPLELLEKAKENKVIIHTSDQTTYTGILEDFDMYVNVSLEDGVYREEDKEAKIGSTIVNGTTITFIELV